MTLPVTGQHDAHAVRAWSKARRSRRRNVIQISGTRTSGCYRKDALAGQSWVSVPLCPAKPDVSQNGDETDTGPSRNYGKAASLHRGVCHEKIVSFTARARGCLGRLIQVASADVITGKVTDASGEAPLQGAIVTIEELGRTAASDRFGTYRFNNIPAGDYTLSVSYICADVVTSDVSLAGTATVDFTVGSDARYLDNILVVGSTAAQAGAINQQRASNALIAVVDSDGLGNFPDTTVADSLGRVPGLSIENDQGEGRYVSIRGINTDLIASSINGVRTPSPEDRRGVLLDGVPSDLLDGTPSRSR